MKVFGAELNISIKLNSDSNATNLEFLYFIDLKKEYFEMIDLPIRNFTIIAIMDLGLWNCGILKL